jgi:hypothetical protein
MASYVMARRERRKYQSTSFSGQTRTIPVGDTIKQIGVLAGPTKIKAKAAKWAKDVESLQQWKSKALITVLNHRVHIINTT